MGDVSLAFAYMLFALPIIIAALLLFGVWSWLIAKLNKGSNHPIKKIPTVCLLLLIIALEGVLLCLPPA